MLSTLAFYLPQFHRVPENDEWWGEGFTEWTAVKGAEKLFEDHNQPRIPLNKNYYNLLEHDTMAWQANLMKKYRVDGMCFYHYWFENGRRVLEKPAENLLKWTDISMPFCFCWANETWSRTWKKITDSNVWSSTYETKKNSDDNGILLKQSYGREREWEEHINYLLSFFKDKRYIKLNGMPVFAILKPSKIFCLWNMIHYFDTKVKENGFPGLYVIGMEDMVSYGLSATCIKQPNYAIRDYYPKSESGINTLATYSYDEVWEIALDQKIKKEKTYLCGIVDFDTTPRMGKRGQIMEGVSAEKFYFYFKKLYQKSLQLGNDYIFINAWNEWGEGMYLEPDQQNKYAYLEAIYKVVIECEKENVVSDKTHIDEYYETQEEKNSRMREESISILYRHDELLDKWLYLRDNHINFDKYFLKYGYENIAIYGMGKLGMHLLHELQERKIHVLFGIDRNIDNNNDIIKIYNPKDNIPQVDAIVITVTNQYGVISEQLTKHVSCSMITIEEIIEELFLET